MIKVLGGKYKNRKLKYFKFSNVRPTQSRVKKSLFDSLIDIENKRVLDLFCGVGTLGIEALSRGAESVTFVDNNYNAVNTLKKNLSLLSIVDNFSIVYRDALRYLNYEESKFDIVIADPPYNKFSFIDFLPFVSKVLIKNGIFCYETHSKESFNGMDVKMKKFGNTKLIFWRKYE
tara:strand:- start:3838 stop:4362 length:525 start_codon:yes stop_codon:yes gene_type:complete